MAGRVESGLGKGAGFIRLDWVREQVRQGFGIEAWPGTLNLQLAVRPGEPAERGSLLQEVLLLSDPAASGACVAEAAAVRLAGSTPALVVVPHVAGYPADRVEVVAAINLREHLGLQDGDSVSLVGVDLAGVRAVIFDVDGTLVDSIGAMRTAAMRAASLYGFDVPLEAVRNALNRGESLWEQVVPPEARGDTALLAELHVQTRHFWHETVVESVEVIAGLDRTLAQLRAAGVALAIYSGSRGESFRPLASSGHLDCFEPVITAVEVSRPKPHPEGLWRCLQRLRCQPEEAIYVGDTAQDIAAAHAAGMRAVGVLTGAADSASLSAAGADRLVPSHRELPVLLGIGC